MSEPMKLPEAQHKNSKIAAFFDLDGTLVSLPSQERQFFRMLRDRQEIPFRNYFLWLCEVMRRLPRGIWAVAHTNKIYLRGVAKRNRIGGFIPPCRRDAGICDDFLARKSDHGAEGQKSTTPPNRARPNPRWPVPRFLEEALERAAWHARQGHALVIVSGTLEPLAHRAARELQAELLAQGLVLKIRVCATRLEEADGMWTGNLLGEAMFGKAKARSVQRLAQKMHLDLLSCYAYGNSINDEAMLMSVGNPITVNPTRALARIAKERSWRTLRWKKERELTQKTGISQRGQRRGRSLSPRPPAHRKIETKKKEEPASGSLLQHSERYT